MTEIIESIQTKISGLPFNLLENDPEINLGPQQGVKRAFVQEGKVKKVSHGKSQPRHLFLFNDVLIYTQVTKEHISYVYKGHIFIRTMLLQDLPPTKDGSHVLEIIRVDEKKAKYLFLFKTQIDKLQWMHAIQRQIEYWLQILRLEKPSTGTGRRRSLSAGAYANTVKRPPSLSFKHPTPLASAISGLAPLSPRKVDNKEWWLDPLPAKLYARAKVSPYASEDEIIPDNYLNFSAGDVLVLYSVSLPTRDWIARLYDDFEYFAEDETSHCGYVDQQHFDMYPAFPFKATVDSLCELNSDKGLMTVQAGEIVTVLENSTEYNCWIVDCRGVRTYVDPSILTAANWMTSSQIALFDPIYDSTKLNFRYFPSPYRYAVAASGGLGANGQRYSAGEVVVVIGWDAHWNWWIICHNDDSVSTVNTHNLRFLPHFPRTFQAIAAVDSPPPVYETDMKYKEGDRVLAIAPINLAGAHWWVINGGRFGSVPLNTFTITEFLTEPEIEELKTQIGVSFDMNGLYAPNPKQVEVGLRHKIVSLPKLYAQAIYSFSATEEHDLSCMEGQCIVVECNSSPDWWYAINNEEKGYLPTSYLGFLPPAPFKAVLDGGSEEIEIVQYDENQWVDSKGAYYNPTEVRAKEYLSASAVKELTITYAMRRISPPGNVTITKEDLPLEYDKNSRVYHAAMFGTFKELQQAVYTLHNDPSALVAALEGVALAYDLQKVIFLAEQGAHIQIMTTDENGNTVAHSLFSDSQNWDLRTVLRVEGIAQVLAATGVDFLQQNAAGQTAVDMLDRHFPALLEAVNTPATLEVAISKAKSLLQRIIDLN